MIYLITNRTLVNSDEEYFNRIEKAVEGGVSTIILREKHLPSNILLEYALGILKIIDKTNCKLIINSNEDVYNLVNAYGLHLTFKDFLSYSKKKNQVIGVSVHSIEEAIKADKLGATYVLASNVFETKCKEGLKGKGLGFIKDVKKSISCELIALGGITYENMINVQKAGADGVAMMSIFFV